ncbi:Xaa-Pro peptidase family protein [Desulfosarcina sp. OttesenSCG-928-A07]|nr:Xaa-Pro peptidase family protein [Desulfosarcina sp. OttesenSCG-928-A07]
MTPPNPLSTESPHLDRVPASEIQDRITRFQQWLGDKLLDGAFLLQNVDCYYFSATLQRGVLFIPAQGVPLFMVGKSVDRARQESPLNQILPLPRHDDMVAYLTDYGHRTRLRRIGLELDVLPAARYIWFREKFPDAEFVDVSPGIRKLRMVKSDYEVRQLRRSAAVMDKGYAEIRSLLREGMTELAVDAILAGIARQEGHMGLVRMRGWNQEMPTTHVLVGPDSAVISCCETPVCGPGPSPAMPQGAGFSRIVKNQPIYIDFGVAVNGYHGDQTRVLVMGKLDPVLERAHDCALSILQHLEAVMRPGMACSEIFHAAQTISAKHGLADHFMGHGEGQMHFLGHGIGLEIDELPVMAPRFTAPIQEGMVFALEPKFTFPGLGTVGIEDDYRVTATGVERLTLTEQNVLEIWPISKNC